MSSSTFIGVNETKEVKDSTLADYSFSFSLEKYQKLSGTHYPPDPDNNNKQRFTKDYPVASAALMVLHFCL